jgi:TolA-binding protein
VSDPDYLPAYQDEYQRLWHEAAAERDALRAENERLREDALLQEERIRRQEGTIKELRGTVEAIDHQNKRLLEELNVYKRALAAEVGGYPEEPAAAGTGAAPKEER